MSIRFYTTARRPWGAEHSLVLLITELARLGETVEVWCCSREVAEFISKNSPAKVKQVRLRNRLQNLLNAVSDLRNERPDVAVVFSLELLPVALLYRALVCRSRPVELTFDVHDVPKKKHVRAMLNFFSRFFTNVVAISEYSAQQLPTRGAVIVVPRPISESSPVTRSEKTAGTLKLAILGRLDPEKRVDLAIRAVGEAPEVELAVFGESYLADGEYEAYLRELAQRLAPGRVKFEGYTPIDRALRATDTLLVCNENEPSGRTVGEALMRGVDVIVPDTGGSREYIQSHFGLEYRGANLEDLVVVLRRRIAMQQNTIDVMRAEGRARMLSERGVAAIGLQYHAAVTRKGAGFDA